MWDVTARTAIAALDGLARRTEVRSHNVANAHTPEFRAGDVAFEANLREALHRGHEPSARTTPVTPAFTLVDDRGNSVDLEHELVGAMKDQLHRDAMVAAINFKSGQVRAVVNGQR